MYFVHFSKEYRKSIKKLVKSSKVKLSDVDIVIDLIACGGVLPIKYRDHKLRGEYDGYRECRIQLWITKLAFVSFLNYQIHV